MNTFTTKSIFNMKHFGMKLWATAAVFALAGCGAEQATNEGAEAKAKAGAETEKQKDNLGEVLSNGVYNINTEKSTVGWKAAKVSGEHFGSVSIQKGSLEVKSDVLADAQIYMDMKSITVEDMEGEYADKLRGHLHSEDFFATEQFPTAMFNLAGIKYVDGQYIASGTMQIKETTGPVSFPVNLTNNNGAVEITGTAVIDRTKYGIKYGSGQFFEDLGDKMIYDEFELKFNLTAEPRG